MTEIPKSVFDLSLLEVLTFGVTEMKSIQTMASLPNLRWLTLTVNQLEYLPDDICSLERLEGLQLAKNKIKKLPDRIGDLNLKFITLYSNEIIEIPESFFDLKLKKLNLSLNKIKDKNRLIKTFGSIDFLSI
jgi:Leucine-rich repeat (LRR) protein